MVNYWFISGDFLADRKKRIGASDIPALIPDPERPNETLAAYTDNNGKRVCPTPVTIYQEKTGRKESDPSGLPAEMGHFLEKKALELFIRGVKGHEIAMRFVHELMAYEFTTGAVPQAFQNTQFKHNAQFYRDGVIVHPDAIYDPSDITYGVIGEKGKVTKWGVTIDTTKPFLIEAKSANFWATLRPEGSMVRGYDLKLKTWQGIPLKHYMQIQFQLALLEVDVAYLALISNTSDFNVWQIRANKAHQGKLIDLAGKMVWHIEHDQPPKDMAINSQDIIDLYPEIGEDFVFVEGDERYHAIRIAQKFRQAERQAKRWEAVKTDALDAMAVLLKDRPEIRDAEGIIGKWRITKGSEKMLALSKIRDDNPLAYRYLQRKELLYTSKGSRKPMISWKDEE